MTMETLYISVICINGSWDLNRRGTNRVFEALILDGKFLLLRCFNVIETTSLRLLYLRYRQNWAMYINYKVPYHVLQYPPSA